jgi:hypothetical protein
MAIGRVGRGVASVEILRAARGAGTDLIVVGVGGDGRGGAGSLDRVARSVLWGFRGSVLIARAGHAIAEYAVDTNTTAWAPSVIQRLH